MTIIRANNALHPRNPFYERPVNSLKSYITGPYQAEEKKDHLFTTIAKYIFGMNEKKEVEIPLVTFSSNHPETSDIEEIAFSNMGKEIVEKGHYANYYRDEEIFDLEIMDKEIYSEDNLVNIQSVLHRISRNVLNPIERRWVVAELLSKGIAYRHLPPGASLRIPWTDANDQPIVTNYQITSFNLSDGMPAYWLRPSTEDESPPFIVIRGTYSIPSLRNDIGWTAFRHDYGKSAFYEGKELIKAAIFTSCHLYKQKPILMGHSLGGTLVMHAHKEFSDQINSAYTFNAPGLTDSSAKEWEEKTTDESKQRFFALNVDGDPINYLARTKIGQQFMVYPGENITIGKLHSDYILNKKNVRILTVDDLPKNKDWDQLIREWRKEINTLGFWFHLIKKLPILIAEIFLWFVLAPITALGVLLCELFYGIAKTGIFLWNKIAHPTSSNLDNEMRAAIAADARYLSKHNKNYREHIVEKIAQLENAFDFTAKKIDNIEELGKSTYFDILNIFVEYDHEWKCTQNRVYSHITSDK